MAALDVKGAMRGRPVDHALPLVPFIDFLLCLVAFLLVTAVWSESARLEASARLPKAGSTLTPAPEKRLHVSMKPQVFRLEWEVDQTVVQSREVARRDRLVADQLSYPELARAVERDWQAYGTHRALGDERRDQAVLHAGNNESYAALVAAMDAVRATERGGAPAFEIALAPH